MKKELFGSSVEKSGKSRSFLVIEQVKFFHSLDHAGTARVTVMDFIEKHKKIIDDNNALIYTIKKYC